MSNDSFATHVVHVDGDNVFETVKFVAADRSQVTMPVRVAMTAPDLLAACEAFRSWMKTDCVNTSDLFIALDALLAQTEAVIARGFTRDPQ